MECLSVAKIPEGSQWTYEIKLDGYRLEVVQEKGRVTLYSRRRNVLHRHRRGADLDAAAAASNEDGLSDGCGG